MRYSLPLLFSFCALQFSPMQASALTCEEFQTTYKTQEERLKAYTETRKTFIQDLQLGQYQEKFQQLLKDPDTLIDGSLPLSRLTGLVHEHYKDIAYESLGALEKKIKTLEATADCFDTGSISDKQVMRFIRHDVAETDDPYIGFPLRQKTIDKTQKKVLVTTAATCVSPDNCPFELKNRSDLEKDFILLTHHSQQKLTRDSSDISQAEVEACPAGSDDCRKLPTRIFVEQVELNEVTEWFGQPDIVLLVNYFQGEKNTRHELIPLPWVTHAGINNGHTEIVTWKYADRVTLTLVEKNWNLSSRSIFNTFVKIFGIVYKASQYDCTAINEAITLLSTSISIENNPEEEDIFDTIDHLTADQVIATAEVKRPEGNDVDEVFMMNPEKSVKATLLIKKDFAPITSLGEETPKHTNRTSNTTHDEL